MFVGRFEHTIDSKGRLAIPSSHRPWLAAGLVILRSFERCLRIYPLDKLEEISEKIDQLPHVSQEDVSDAVLYLFGEAATSVPDKQGRVLIPAHLRKYANLQDKAVVVGVRDHVEVWNPEAYLQKNAAMEKDPRTFARGLGKYGIL